MLPKLENCTVAIIGLGYVGLPLMLEIGQKNTCLLTKKQLKRQVFGYDINFKRIEELEKGFDRNKIFSSQELKKATNIKFVNNENSIKDADVFIITVPTPINEKNEPNLSYIKKASKMVGKLIKYNDKRLTNPIIIFESTVYPGLTEEICIPIIERESNKKHNSNEDKNENY